MTQLKQIYKCNVCGNIVEMVHPGQGELVCCGQPMELQQPKTQDEGQEKHVPVIEKEDGKIKVKVGSQPHPMEENHYIEWIELITEDRVYRKHLNPQDQPEAEFNLIADNIQARIYCNVHNLWQSE